MVSRCTLSRHALATDREPHPPPHSQMPVSDTKLTKTMKNIKAFFLGINEFRSNITTNCGDADHAYEWGREIAHRMTFRRFEQV